MRFALLTSLLVAVASFAGAQTSAAPSEPAATLDPKTFGSLCLAERGEMAPESTEAMPLIRFAVTALAEMEQRGRGYLYFSRDRVRYSRGSDGAQGFDLDQPRSGLNRAKEWTVFGTPLGMAELQFRSAGKWRFSQLRCSLFASGETMKAGDPRTFQDLLDATNDFEAAVVRVKADMATRRQAEENARKEQAARSLSEAASRAPVTGSIKLTTHPGGVQVYLGDRFKGSTSEQQGVLIIDGLSPGAYRLRMSLVGFSDWSGGATVTAGQTAEVGGTLSEAGPKPLGVSEIAEALQNGLPKTRIIGFVNKYGVDFALDNENEQRLRTAGADSDLLLAVAKNKK